MPIILTGTPYTVTARAIIQDALTFGLNRLSPGETLDADLADICLSALNSIVDEFNGSGALLWREQFTQSTPITGEYGTLGTDWAGLGLGVQILGATIRLGDEDVPMCAITPGQYEYFAQKDLDGTPQYYSHDGADLVWLYPRATAELITLRTREPAAQFSDLDTEHAMPNGYRSALAALLAERMAPSLAAMTPFIMSQARAARVRLQAYTLRPAILDTASFGGSDILRGY